MRLPNRPILETEMRRRLWNTILEITLQSSLSSGGPPLVSLHYFDAECPGNFDDDQRMGDGHIPKPRDDYTQTSIAIILRKTFPTRLAIARFLNGLHSHRHYEEAVRLDAELRALYETSCQPLAGHLSSTPTKFETCALELLFNRYLGSLHVPFFDPAMRQVRFAYSLEVVVESSVKIWYLAHPSSSVLTSQRSSNPELVYQDDLSRLMLCGSGFFRTGAMQGALLIASELQVQARTSLSATPARPDLHLALNDAVTWCLRCIQAGDTNNKRYILMCIVSAHITVLCETVRVPNSRSWSLMP